MYVYRISPDKEEVLIFFFKKTITFCHVFHKKAINVLSLNFLIGV